MDCVDFKSETESTTAEGARLQILKNGSEKELRCLLPTKIDAARVGGTVIATVFGCIGTIQLLMMLLSVCPSDPSFFFSPNEETEQDGRSSTGRLLSFLETTFVVVQTTTTIMARSAPQLTFDDGSRAMQEHAPMATVIGNGENGRDESISIRDYYEIDRLVQQVCELRDRAVSTPGVEWKNRIALQFPDELLSDAPHVCWEFELALEDCLVFCLGDTTYQSCCPDQVAAAHLQADCIIHYGHACLSTCSMPVLYSFGRASMSVEQAVDATVKLISEQSIAKLLILYEVKYQIHMEELETQLQLAAANLNIITGRIPVTMNLGKRIQSNCGQENCCSSTTAVEPNQNGCSHEDTNQSANSDAEDGTIHDIETRTPINFSSGGLDIPTDLDSEPFSLLYVGDESCRQYLNIVLRFLSTQNQPQHYLTWRPKEEQLVTDLSPRFQKQLNRRFFMVQKARLASVFGILVANLSDRQTQSVVLSLQQMIHDHDRASYIFAVGKLNPAKLSNFGEIDCFVLVACPEHSLLEDDRDYPIPIITPAELSMALGITEWGNVDYSLNIEDFLQNAESAEFRRSSENDDNEFEDDDAPYFNPVSGQYESRLLKRGEEENLNLEALPGKGALITYNSAAADFLKTREYKGLQVDAGKTEVKAAVVGQDGIASHYNDR